VLLGADGSSTETELLSKEALAALVLDFVVRYLGGPLGGPST
jgi:hypothetical protein